jgi:nitrate reductase cytochrome c-type subunit
VSSRYVVKRSATCDAPKVNPVTAEYQLCLKCHSAAAYGTTLPDASQNPTAGTSFWRSPTYTDQAKEFSPGNPSYHAVWGGSTASTFGTYRSGWTSTSKMYCSDCHKSDAFASPTVVGAHASNTPFMLGGFSDPTASRYVTGLGDASANPTADFAFCLQCHDLSAAVSSGFSEYDASELTHTNLHAKGHGTLSCTVCHVAVPHGAQLPHLIVLAGYSPPYNDGSAKIVSYAASGDRTYAKTNCTVAVGCHPTPSP